MIAYTGQSKITRRIVEAVNDLDGERAGLRLYDDTSTRIGSLSDVPANAYGRMCVRGDLVPFGGTSSTYQNVMFLNMAANLNAPVWKSLTVQAASAGTAYVNTYTGSSWTGWKQITQ